MAKGTIEILGADELNYIFDNLPRHIGRKIILSALRKGANVLIKQARQNIQNFSKTLAKSIGTVTSKNKNSPSVWVGPQRKKGGWFAHFVEFGTVGVKRTTSAGGDRGNKAFLWVSRVKKGGRYRKDFRARPFMRPAFDVKQNEITGSIGKNLSAAIDSFVKRNSKKFKV